MPRSRGHFTNWKNFNALDFFYRYLTADIKLTDRLNHIVKKMEPQRIYRGRWKHVNNIPANTKFSTVFHHWDTAITIIKQTSFEKFTFKRFSLHHRKGLIAQFCTRYDTLHESFNGNNKKRNFFLLKKIEYLQSFARYFCQGRQVFVRKNLPGGKKTRYFLYIIKMIEIS